MYALYQQLNGVIPRLELKKEEGEGSDSEWNEPSPAASFTPATREEIPSEDSRILEYYRFGTLELDLAMSFGDLEDRHDYIQFMFPLMETSAHHPNSPLLSERQVAEFQKNEDFLQKMKLAWKKMLTFYGLALNGEQEVILSDQFERRKVVWLKPGNHNFLRVTRIIKSLTLVGLNEEATATFRAFKQIYDSHPDIINATTFEYWKSALGV